jgi:hypothetical protein
MLHYPALLLLLLTLNPPPTPPAVTYQGTVQAIQTHPAGIDLLTGVGFALRVVHMRTVPTTTADSAGITIPMTHVKAGDVVRVDCSTSPTGLVADHVAKLGLQGSRGTP